MCLGKSVGIFKEKVRCVCICKHLQESLSQSFNIFILSLWPVSFPILWRKDWKEKKHYPVILSIVVLWLLFWCQLMHSCKQWGKKNAVDKHCTSWGVCLHCNNTGLSAAVRKQEKDWSLEGLNSFCCLYLCFFFALCFLPVFILGGEAACSFCPPKTPAPVEQKTSCCIPWLLHSFCPHELKG